MITENQLVASGTNERRYLKYKIVTRRSNIAQRTNNIHKAQPEQHKKLLKENVTKKRINRASQKISLNC